MRRYVASQYLHYRLLRCYFNKDRESDLYGLDLGGRPCHLRAIHVGAQKEAHWLGVEYSLHFDAGYQWIYAAAGTRRSSSSRPSRNMNMRSKRSKIFSS